MAKKYDITTKVEVMEDSKKRFGLSFSGIYCSAELNLRFSEHFDVVCNGEIIGDSLLEDIVLKCCLYDEQGRVLGQGRESFRNETFSGYDVFSINIQSDLKPAKCKLIILND